MVEKDILERFSQCDYIYGYMHCSGHSTSGEIIKINKSQLKLRRNMSPIGDDFQKLAIIYVWGGPGPDFNTYYIEDYKKTWGFTQDDLILND